jgi:glycine oxidase
MAETYDAVVIGGGIIGCSTAWRLAQTGRRVALLERGHIGGEASAAAGGLFVPEASPDVPSHLLDFWNRSNALYPAFVEEVRATTGEAFEFRISGRLVVGFTDGDVSRLRETFAWQTAAGIRVKWLSGSEALAAEPALAPDVAGGIFFQDHGLIDNTRFTAALGRAVRRAGGDVFPNRQALGFAVDGERVDGVETLVGRLSAPVVVNCAGSWAGLIDPRARQPIRPAKGQMLAVEARPMALRLPVAGPGGSALPRADGRTLIGATIHDVGFDKDVIASDVFGLFDRTARILPGLRQARFLEAWAGLRPVAPDHQPIIAPDPEIGGLYWGTGHYTMGILSAPATAQALTELIATGKSSIPIDEFGVERFKVSALQPVP